MKRGPAKHRVCGGVFQADKSLPPDHLGRETCRCGLVGKPGDTHHDAPEPVTDARGLAAGDHEES